MLKRKVPACWQRNEGSNLQVVDSDREPELSKSSAGKASACETSACGSVKPQVMSVELLGSHQYISSLTCSPFSCVVKQINYL